MTSKAPSPRSRPSSVAGIVASSADSVRPSTQASSAVVVGASAMAAMLADRALTQSKEAGARLGAPMALLTIFAVIAGAGTALTPCVLPVLPALLSASATGGRRPPPRGVGRPPGAPPNTRPGPGPRGVRG